MTQICPMMKDARAVRPYLPSESSPMKKDALVIEKQSYFVLPLQVEYIE